MRTKTAMTLLMLGLFSLSLSPASSQELSKKEQRKAEKQKKEELAQSAIKLTPLQEKLKAGKFVLEADRIQVTGGKSIYVTANDNFVLMNEGESTVQLAFQNGVSGLNGAGGVTASGKVVDMESRVSKKGTLTLQYTIMSNYAGAPMDVVITLPPGGNYASARVSNSINFSGKLLPLDNSSVFKGRDFISVPRGL